jgi:secreted PhoX family phosphatase
MSSAPDFATILQRRISRRNILRAGGALALASALPLSFVRAEEAFKAVAKTKETTALSTLTFAEVLRGIDDKFHVAEGYSAQILLRWGDKLFPGVSSFDPAKSTGSIQSRQFGYNNDHIQYFPLNPASPSTHGLLCINHEFALPELMFPGGRKPEELTEEEKRIEMAAHGVTVVELRRRKKGWKPILGRYNRRITATTPMRISGPAAYSPRMQTTADPKGDSVLGTFGNCAGGQTPWGTYLTAEENIDGYFNLNDYDGPELANHQKMTIGKKLYYRWDQIDPRFDVKAEPHEPNRFGWVVEIDPLDADSPPVKRTALGRYKHESATCVRNKNDDRIVVYSGDDQFFQYIYRFVSTDPYAPGRKAHNRTLLDNGVLTVAKFREDGSVEWLPLVWGQGPLIPENGFNSQADVLIETRRAADVMGATPMDRPEDIEVSPVTGRIYIALTKNCERKETDIVNRRYPNPMGYILELSPPGEDGARDHTTDRFQWDMFLEGGDPHSAEAATKGSYGGEVSKQGFVACPDNLAFDAKGRLWITTDGQEEAIQSADTVYATDTTGQGRAIPRAFARGPQGCEMTGPCFTPDGKTLFISVQHPGQGGTYDEPITRWPDFDDNLPPRPAVVAITKDDGGVIGD